MSADSAQTAMEAPLVAGSHSQGTAEVRKKLTRELLLKMKSGSEILIHSSCPIAVIKLIWAGESYHRLKVNYVRVSLASQTAVRALPQTAYVWLDWSDGPAPGPDPWWKPVWKVIKDTLEQPWCMPCPEQVAVQLEEQLTPYVRSKVAFTAMLVLPDGRWYAELEEGGNISDLRQALLTKWVWSCFFAICGCSKHWVQLADEMNIQKGAGVMMLTIVPWLATSSQPSPRKEKARSSTTSVPLCPIGGGKRKGRRSQVLEHVRMIASQLSRPFLRVLCPSSHLRRSRGSISPTNRPHRSVPAKMGPCRATRART